MAKFVPKLDNINFNNFFDPARWGPLGDGYQYDKDKPERNKILINRNVGPFPRADLHGGPLAHEYENAIKSHIEGFRRIFRPNPVFTDAYTFEQANKRQQRDGKIQKDFIAIVDIDSSPYTYVQLPFVPREVQYNPQSNFVGIASFGRNNPYYQFTGSEDTVTFEIDWFAQENHREDVLFKCRWLEALTKGDGYKSRPHRCMIIWGANTDQYGEGDKLFGEKTRWLLVSAPYSLTEFNRGYMDRETGEFVNTHMLPQQAVQQVTFKRLAETNRTTLDILGDLQPSAHAWNPNWGTTDESPIPGSATNNQNMG